MPSQEQGQSIDTEKEAAKPVGKIWRIWNPLWEIRRKGSGALFASWTVFGMLLLLSPYQLTNWIASVREVTVWDPKTDGGILGVDSLLTSLAWNAFSGFAAWPILIVALALAGAPLVNLNSTRLSAQPPLDEDDELNNVAGFFHLK